MFPKFPSLPILFLNWPNQRVRYQVIHRRVTLILLSCHYCGTFIFLIIKQNCYLWRARRHTHQKCLGIRAFSQDASTDMSLTEEIQEKHCR